MQRTGQMRLDSLIEQMTDRLGGLAEPFEARSTGSDPPPALTEELVPAGISRFIEHTLLKPDARQREIRRLCEEARHFGFATVCVNPDRVAWCAEWLTPYGVDVATVIGFPLGATTPAVKAAEAAQCVARGADELDMVLNIGRLKDQDYKAVRDDIRAVVEEAGNCPVKVILETSYLSDTEMVAACLLAGSAGAAFVKTSTGFGPAGATAADVRLLRRTVGGNMGVKAAGGIRTTAQAMAMLTAGANRIGTSASLAIIGAAAAATPEPGKDPSGANA